MAGNQDQKKEEEERWMMAVKQLKKVEKKQRKREEELEKLKKNPFLKPKQILEFKIKKLKTVKYLEEGEENLPQEWDEKEKLRREEKEKLRRDPYRIKQWKTVDSSVGFVVDNNGSIEMEKEEDAEERWNRAEEQLKIVETMQQEREKKEQQGRERQKLSRKIAIFKPNEKEVDIDPIAAAILATQPTPQVTRDPFQRVVHLHLHAIWGSCLR